MNELLTKFDIGDTTYMYHSRWLMPVDVVDIRETEIDVKTVTDDILRNGLIFTFNINTYEEIGNKFSRKKLFPVTKEVYEKILINNEATYERKTLVEQIVNRAWHYVSLDKLKRIVAILKEKD